MNGLSFLSAIALAAFFTWGCTKKSSQFIASDRPFYEQPDRAFEFPLERLNTNFEVIGNVTEFGRLRRDGWVDFSLVTPGLTRAGLIDLQITTIVSPYTDVLKLPLGQSQNVPSNITFPNQKERYGLISIRFNKPYYRYFVEEPGVYKLAATHGKLRLRQMIDDSEDGKSLFDMMNNFTFLGGGTRDVVVNENITGQDVPVNQYAFTKDLPAVMGNIGPGLAVLAVSLTEKEGLLVPTDMKTLRANESLNLKTIDDSAQKIILHLMRTDDIVMSSTDFYRELTSIRNDPERETVTLNQASIVVQESEFGLAPQFLDLIEPPTETETEIQVNPPPSVRDVNEVATRFSIVEVETVESDQANFEKLTTIWTETYEGWLLSIEKPSLKIELDPNKNYRWQVVFMGQTGDTQDDTNPLDLSQITHVTQNAADITVSQ